MSRGLEILTGARVGDFAALHIDPIELSDLIEMHGMGAELRRAISNPNQRIETHSARINGYGRGLPWVYPLDRREPVIVVLQNRGPKAQLVMAGDIVTGQAWALFPLGIQPGDGDLLLPEGEVHVINETIHRAEQQIDNSKLRGRAYDDRIKPPPKMTPKAEKLLYPDPCCIEGIWWVNDDDDGLCKGTEGLDYQIVGGNEIRWREGRGPQAGKSYSIRYTAPAAYVCTSGAPIFRSEGGQAAMPYRCQVQRLDRWGEPDVRENR